MKRLLPIIFIASIIFCTQQKKKDVIVKVDGFTLTKEDFKRYIPEQNYKQLSDEKLKELLNNWAEQEMLYLEAKKQKIDQEDSIRLVIEQYEKNMLASILIRRAFGSTTVTESEIKDYFDKHKSEFLYAVKLGQIVLPSYEIARQTLEEIRAGADFFKLAKERSLTKYENPENPKVVTEFLPRGQIADYGTEEIIFKMKPGEISDVIPYLQGTYLIVKMIDKKKIYAKADYSKYRDGIYNYLLSKKYQKFLKDYVDSLKQHYKITIDLTPLK